MNYEKIEQAALHRNRILKAVTYILLTFWAILVLFPFYWMVLTSVKASAQRHRDKLAASLNKRVAKGKMTQEAADDLMSRVIVEEFDAAADADLVIECVAENMAVKKELLGRLDAIEATQTCTYKDGSFK